MDDIDCPCDSLDIDECYVVVRDYVKSSVDELDLFEGQIVCVIDSSDSGKKSEICLCPYRSKPGLL